MAPNLDLAAAQKRVFLSHAGSDAPAARALADILRRNGIEGWFDQDSLQPGDRWMATLETIRQSSAMLVYVGRIGVQNWVDREVRLGLELTTRNPAAFKLIPVFGDGASVISLPPFLAQQQGVAANDPPAIRRLLDVLHGTDARRAVPSDYWALSGIFSTHRHVSCPP